MSESSLKTSFGSIENSLLWWADGQMVLAVVLLDALQRLCPHLASQGLLQPMTQHNRSISWPVLGNEQPFNQSSGTPHHRWNFLRTAGSSPTLPPWLSFLPSLFHKGQTCTVIGRFSWLSLAPYFVSFTDISLNKSLPGLHVFSAFQKSPTKKPGFSYSSGEDKG